jgi:hypothetical protein
MLLNKITTGFVIQTFDTEKKKFVSQEFVAGDQVDIEDKNGDPVDPSLLEVDGKPTTFPFDMTQPQLAGRDYCPNCNESLIVDTEGDRNCPKCGKTWSSIKDDDKQKKARPCGKKKVSTMPKPIEIVVEVQGRCVVAVHASSKDVAVELLDWDNVKDGDATPAERREAKRLEKKAKGMHGVF